MKKILNISLILTVFIIFSSCKDDMTKLNTNDEQLISTNPVFVFTDATENWNNSSRQHLMGKYQGVMQLMQYIVNSDGPTDGIYASTGAQTNPTPYLPYYSDFFSNHGTKLYHLINRVISSRIDKDLYQNVSAISQILLTYETWLVFDTHGAIPYKEALQGLEGINTPKYDMLENVYKDFDVTLKKQIDILSSDIKDQKKLEQNDFFYQGDTKKWAKFANTLRIKIAQRFEKVDKTFYESVVSDALSLKCGIISNNDESCVYYHNMKFNSDTWDTAVLTYQYDAANAFASFLGDNNDPRTSILLRRNGFGEGNNNPTNDNLADTLAKYVPDYKTKYPKLAKRYVGMPASPDMKSKNEALTYTTFSINIQGKKDPVTFKIRGISQVQSRLYVKNGGNSQTAGGAQNIDYPYVENFDNISLFTPLITYPETCLMMAEISEKAGGNKGGKSAQQWYEDGIKASMQTYQKWGERMKVLAASDSKAGDYSPITDAKINAYLTQPQIKYTGSLEHKMQLIIAQAWVNFFMRPEEAWATWKRTGYPVFKDYTLANPTDGTAFLDKIKGGGNELLVPRRSNLPTPNNANLSNYQDAIKKLTAQPNYLQQYQSQGRIWWDAK